MPYGKRLLVIFLVLHIGHEYLVYADGKDSIFEVTGDDGKSGSYRCDR